MSTDGAKKHTLECGKLPVSRVVVFNDRAEVTRDIALKLEKGLNEVEIENLPAYINEDSVAVRGKGATAASIAEVQVRDRRQHKKSAAEEDKERVAALKEAVRVAKDAVAKATDKKTALAFKLQALDEWTNALGRSTDERIKVAAKEGKSTLNDVEDSLKAIGAIFTYHQKESLETKDAMHAVEKELEKATEKLTTAEAELREALPAPAQPANTAGFGLHHFSFVRPREPRVISVLLESAEGGDVLLSLSYQTTGANWRPLYDIRVTTGHDNPLQVTYQAAIRQNTGEDWAGGQLILSTAQPSQGGTLPELRPLDVSISRPQYFPPPSTKPAYGGSLFGGAGITTGSTTTSLFGASPAVGSAFGGAPAAPEPEQPVLEEEITHASAFVTQTAISTEFAIARPVNIPSDGASHKVTIGVVALAARLLHEMVPSRNPSAFLSASATNTSSLALLPGPASIYLDGAFVTKTQMKSVSPGEKFTASLGVDPAIRMEYKPAERYHKEAGMISKWSSIQHEQKMVVKNTRNDAVILTIKERIPRSNDEKIKVTILSPKEVERPSEETLAEEEDSGEARALGARLLPSSNILEWTVRVEKGESLPLSLKWQLEHPISEKIVFKERI